MDSDRINLQFVDTVREKFCFLESYGFKCDYFDLYVVKYTSKKVYVNVYHEKISFEVYLSIGLIPQCINNKYEIGLDDILKKSNSGITYYLHQASEKESLKKVIAYLAQLLEMHGEKALAGEYEYYQEIIDNKQIEIELQHNKLELTRIENQASEAWKNKDYSLIVRLYMPYADQLSEIQKRRLKYAKRKLA